MTVYDNIALPLRETTNLGRAEINSRVMARIEQTERSDAAYKYPAELSGGMQNMLGIEVGRVGRLTMAQESQKAAVEMRIQKGAEESLQ